MSDAIKEIEKLAELRDRGILTDEEFQQKKTQLLADNRLISDTDSTTNASATTSGTSSLEKESTGWTKKALWGYILLSALIPIVGVIVGIVAMTKGGKKVRQGVILIIVSVGVALLYIAAVGDGGESQSAVVQMVQNGTLEGYPSKTLGEAVEGFFQSPSWKAITASDGKTYVNVTGRTSFMDSTVEVLLQYRVDADTGEFELQAFEMNDVPQNMIMYSGLLSAMYNE